MLWPGPIGAIRGAGNVHVVTSNSLISVRVTTARAGCRV
jgi:hypothetical protein